MTHSNDETEKRYCLCSDPEYCLRHVQDKTAAIAYRKAHGAPLPKEAE